MIKYVCQKCNKEFATGDEVSVVDTRCPICGSIKIKTTSLVPSKGFIKAFLLYETKKCRNCGRKLTNEESIKRGFGPSCALLFTEKWLHKHPTDLGEKARKLWTKEEIENLIKFAKSGERK